MGCTQSQEAKMKKKQAQMAKSPMEAPPATLKQTEEQTATEAIPTDLVLNDTDKSQPTAKEETSSEVKETSAEPQESKEISANEPAPVQAEAEAKATENVTESTPSPKPKPSPEGEEAEESVDANTTEPVGSASPEESKEDVSVSAEEVEVNEAKGEEGREEDEEATQTQTRGGKKAEEKRHSVSDIVSQWNKNKSPLPACEASSSQAPSATQEKTREIPDLPRSASSVKDKIKMFGSPEPRKLNSDAIKETIQRERHASVQSEVNDRLSSAKMAKYWEVTAEVKKAVVSEQTF